MKNLTPMTQSEMQLKLAALERMARWFNAPLVAIKASWTETVAALGATYGVYVVNTFEELV